jgi:hypothetical protein
VRRQLAANAYRYGMVQDNVPGLLQRPVISLLGALGFDE